MKLDHTRAPIFDITLDYAKKDIVSMIMPAHGQGKGISQKWKDYVGENIFRMDISDLPGQDDFYEPESAILEAQELAADAWGAKETFFSVNGTSAANIAAICSLVSEGDKIIVPRNCHKSVIYGLIVSGAVPVYAIPDVYDEYGIIGGMDPSEVERVYAANPDAKAVISVVPTYHGVYSDLTAISSVVHRHDGIHMVDEAHGNHVYFNDKYPKGALECGADIVTQSTHKVSGSLQQSSMLHVNSDLIDTTRIRFNMQMMQNTSASGLLVISLDLARQYMALHGREALDDLLELIQYGHDSIRKIPGFSIVDKSFEGKHHISAIEPSRLVISAKDLGITGYELQSILAKEYEIHTEFSDNYYAAGFPGLGAVRGDIDSLITACREISERFAGNPPLSGWKNKLPAMPPAAMTPREAYTAPYEKIAWADAKGRVCVDMIVPYPPGIPAICPGEVINDEVWTFLTSQQQQGIHLHGVRGGSLDGIRVVK
ncbi:MAG: aminotransferase class I/II-fold pyridoxal phosphate-dependent enzyme [Firmicutes bacterium]|nr:aminotransferase class I/II-fold pyridoxal phosphate-dependent enzyme [Bacillota bacterium]